MKRKRLLVTERFSSDEAADRQTSSRSRTPDLDGSPVGKHSCGTRENLQGRRAQTASVSQEGILWKPVIFLSVSFIVWPDGVFMWKNNPPPAPPPAAVTLKQI